MEARNLGRFACIGTHHKTGTVWMRRVWHAISRSQNIGLIPMYRPKRLADLPETGPQIIVNWSSNFPDALFAMNEARFLHVIRDPRDILLSGARYHEVAPLGREKFLAVPQDAWEGRNYQEQIKHLDDPSEKLLFEMEQKHAATLREMLAWSYGGARKIELRYEELIEDYDCTLFRAALMQMNITGLDVEQAVQCYWDESLFGGKSKEGYLQSIHIHSGSKAQWETKLPKSVAKIYAEKHGEALKLLGYARDNSWVDKCVEAI